MLSFPFFACPNNPLCSVPFPTRRAYILACQLPLFHFLGGRRICPKRCSLRNEVLSERRRADEAQRDAKDERRLRSLGPAASAASAAAAAGGESGDGADGGDEDVASLRRKLELAASEVEALRTHANDLRSQIQSGWWSWRRQAAPAEAVAGAGAGQAASGGGDAVEFLGSASGACAAAEAALRELGIARVDGGSVGGGGGGGGGGCDESSASLEVDRLTSLLAERDAQVSVLSSTVEALQTCSALAPPSPSPGKGGGRTSAEGDTARNNNNNNSNNSNNINSSPSPQHQHHLRGGAASRGHGSSRRGTPAGAPAGASSCPSSSHPRRPFFWADASSFGETMEADGGGGGGGVGGLLGHVEAQGLARRCVALAARLSSAVAREGRAERRAERLAAEAARRERRMAAAAEAEAGLADRNRLLASCVRKTAAALDGLRAESAARLREAGEEASKLR